MVLPAVNVAVPVRVLPSSLIGHSTAMQGGIPWLFIFALAVGCEEGHFESLLNIIFGISPVGLLPYTFVIPRYD
jgi:hypothetical protein